jgi:integrase
MATVRKHYRKWQAVVRVNGHPSMIKSFVSKTDAKRWAEIIEVKLRREEAGIARIKFPNFEEVAQRYIEEISVLKKSYSDEKCTILNFLKENWSTYPINRIVPDTINKYKNKRANELTGSTINRRLDVLSSMYTTFKKEWGYPVENPILCIRRPKRAEPRNRRFTDNELNKLIKGNRTSPKLRLIIEIALETAMRQGEILRVKHEDINGNTLFIPIAKTKPRTIPLTLKAMSLLNNAELPFNITGNALSKQFKKLCSHYGIEDAHFHDLRRQSLTNFMLERNLSVAETMMIAGHSDPRMLLRTYNNLKVEDVAKKLT